MSNEDFPSEAFKNSFESLEAQSQSEVAAPKPSPAQPAQPAQPVTPVRPAAAVEDATTITQIAPETFEVIDSSEFPAIEIDSFIRKSTEAIEAGYGVICTRSNYYAELKALDLSSKSKLMNTNLGAFEYYNRLFQLIHSRVVKMSIPVPNYAVWSKITAYNDLETLYFAIFAKTYTDDITFDIKCPKCGTANKAKINSNSIIQVKDEAVYSRIQEVNREVETVDDIKKNSLLVSTWRVNLPVSGFTIDIRIPSLHDYLQVLRKFSNKGFDESAISTFMYVKNFLVKHPQKEAFIRLQDENQIISLLSRLPVDDVELLEKRMTEHTGKYNIEYRIPSFNCVNSSCGNEIEEMPLDLENLVFMKVSGKI